MVMEIMAVLLMLTLAFFKATLGIASVISGDTSGHLTAMADFRRNDTLLQRRAPSSQLSTCGFFNGDPSKPRTAAPGYNCRIDAQNGLWGFCPTTVIVASDCGLAGSCVDDHGCSRACGFTDKTTLTTFTCSGTQYCSTALLTFGVDQTYSYLACGMGPSVDHYLNSPTAQTTVAEPSARPTTEETKSVMTNTYPTSLPSETSRSGSTMLTASTTSAMSISDASLTTPLPASSTTTTVPSSQEQRPNGGPNNLAAIIGGALGGLALLCASAIAIVYFMKRHRPVVSGSRAVRGRHAGAAANSEGFNPTQHNDGPKNRWIPAELSAATEPAELAG